MLSVFLSSLFLSVFAGAKLGLADLLRGFFRVLQTNLVMHGNFMGFGIDADSTSGSNCLNQRCNSNSQADKSFRSMLLVWAERERTYKSEHCRLSLTMT
jgi:hypothetical protein